jgi:flagellar basal body rod protein FlgC
MVIRNHTIFQKGNKMTKILVQDIDWHVWDKRNGDYLGEVFGNIDTVDLWIKDLSKMPIEIQRQIDFGFAFINDKGYVQMPNNSYNEMVEYLQTTYEQVA